LTLLAEKYHFHSDHTLVHNETGEIVDKCIHDKSNQSKTQYKAKQSKAKQITSIGAWETSSNISKWWKSKVWL